MAVIVDLGSFLPVKGNMLCIMCGVLTLMGSVMWTQDTVILVFLICCIFPSLNMSVLITSIPILLLQAVKTYVYILNEVRISQPPRNTK